jgi:hypothetical protein
MQFIPHLRWKFVQDRSLEIRAGQIWGVWPKFRPKQFDERGE